MDINLKNYIEIIPPSDGDGINAIGSFGTQVVVDSESSREAIPIPEIRKISLEFPLDDCISVTIESLAIKLPKKIICQVIQIERQDGSTAMLARLPFNRAQYNIFDQIKAERFRQDVKWGGAHHDNQHSITDWLGFIYNRLDAAIDYEQQKKIFIEVAALAVAALESMDRNGSLKL